MNRQTPEIRRRQQHIDTTAVQSARKPCRQTRSKQRRIVDGAGKFNQQIDIPAACRIVETGTEQPHDALATGFFAGDAANRIGLIGVQAHGESVAPGAEGKTARIAPGRRLPAPSGDASGVNPFTGW